MLTGDVVQMRRFATGLDTPNPSFNELQRGDSAPRSTFGDGLINSGDVTQTRRYATGLDPLTPAAGPTAFGELQSYIGGSVFGETARGTSILRLAEIKSDRATAFGVELESGTEAVATSFTLRYDASKLRKPTVTLVDGLGYDAVLTVNDSVEGELVILVDASGALSVGGTPVRIVNITFESGDGSIEFFGAPSVSDAYGNAIKAFALSLPFR